MSNALDVVDDLVYLAATPIQKSKTQTDRDARRLKNAVDRSVKEMDRSFGKYSKMKFVLDKSWTVGQVLGNAAARRQHSALGLDKPKATIADSSILKSLQKDLEIIYSEGDSAQTRLRAKMCVEAAVKFAFNSAYTLAMESTGTMKMWATTSAVPCSYCKRLSGTVLEWDEEFPKTFEGLKPIKVYKNELYHPPLHPNCKCVLFPVTR